MITMIAAIISALILVLPMLGVNLPSREGARKYHFSGQVFNVRPGHFSVYTDDGAEGPFYITEDTKLIIPGDDTPTWIEINEKNVQVLAEPTVAWGYYPLVVVQVPPE